MIILNNAITRVLTQTINEEYSEINKAAEKYLTEHFDELSAPRSQNLEFVKKGGKWKIQMKIQ